MEVSWRWCLVITELSAACSFVACLKQLQLLLLQALNLQRVHVLSLSWPSGGDFQGLLKWLIGNLKKLQRTMAFSTMFSRKLFGVPGLLFHFQKHPNISKYQLVDYIPIPSALYPHSTPLGTSYVLPLSTNRVQLLQHLWHRLLGPHKSCRLNHQKWRCFGFVMGIYIYIYIYYIYIRGLKPRILGV